MFPCAHTGKEVVLLCVDMHVSHSACTIRGEAAWADIHPFLHSATWDGPSNILCNKVFLLSCFIFVYFRICLFQTYMYWDSTVSSPWDLYESNSVGLISISQIWNLSLRFSSSLSIALNPLINLEQAKAFRFGLCFDSLSLVEARQIVQTCFVEGPQQKQVAVA